MSTTTKPPLSTEQWYQAAYVRRWYVASSIYDELIDRFPALAGMSAEARALRCILGYVAFSAFVPGEECQDVPEQFGQLVLPYKIVASLANTHAHNHGFSAERWIDLFSEKVFPLHPTSSKYKEERARVIRPEPGAEVAALLRRMRQVERVPKGEKHRWLDSGEKVSERTRKQRFSKRHTTPEQRWNRLLRQTPPHHPARRLLIYLSKQPQRRLVTLVRGNWARVEEAIRTLPETDEDKQGTKEWAERLALALYERWEVFYKSSPKTPRLFAEGENLLQFPRAIRKIALSGGVECDLRAAQLAIAAKVWELPIIEQFLKPDEDGNSKSIWEDLARHVGVPAATYKPLLKQAVYSIIFGMTKKRLKANLIDGVDGLPGLGRKGYNRLVRHPVILSLLEARRQKHREARVQGYLKDAWGDQVLMGPDQPIKNVRSLWAYVIQSVELRLMLAILTVLEKEPQIYLLAWQHDGVTLYFGNSTHEPRQRNLIRMSVQKECEELGIHTDLEYVELQ